MRSYVGFSLIELIIAIAIIALLRVFALPLNQDYITRSQTTEAFPLSHDARATVMLHFLNRSEFPSPATGLASLLLIIGQLVETVTAARSATRDHIRVLLNKGASAKISGEDLLLGIVPYAGFIRWNCSGLLNRHLPSACR